MAAAHSYEYEVPPGDTPLARLVADAREGNVVYLTQQGEVTRVLAAPGVGVREFIRLDIERGVFTESQGKALMGILDAFEQAVPAPDRDPDQAWFWTEEWQAGERRVDAQILAGQGRVFYSDEEFMAALEAAIEDPSALR
jgi:hypothetical protein